MRLKRYWKGLLDLFGRPTFRSVRMRRFRPALERLEERLPPAHDTLNTAVALSFAAGPVAQVSGTLNTANQVDLYAVTLHQGDQLTAAINAQQQGSSLQAALRLFDSNGVALSATTSSGGDPQLTFSVTVSETYYIGVSGSGDVSYDPTASGSGNGGSTTGLYSLSVTDLLARFVNATPLGNNGQVQGTLTGGQPQDYSVSGTGNTSLDTFLLATAVPESSPGFEPRLVLYDATGRLLIQSDQQQPGLAGSTLEQHLQTGTYYLEVSAAASTSASVSSQGYQLTTALSFALPPFAPVPVDPTPFSLAVADLGNGHTDIVTVNGGDNTVSVLLGNGDGTFGPAQSFAVGRSPRSVAVADLGNGHPDIVTANNTDGTVTVLLGNGAGTFTPDPFSTPGLPAGTFAVGTQPESVAVADVNGDGHPDIITANYYDGTVSVLLGNGAGTFTPDPFSTPGLPAGTFFVGLEPYALAVADLGNGHSDIVVTSVAYNVVLVLLGNGDGMFTPDSFSSPGLPPGYFDVGSVPESVAVADLGNGHPDIVTGNGSDSTVSVLLGNGDGTFTPDSFSSPGLAPGTFTVGFEPFGVAVADLGNGHSDIVTANFGDSTVSVLLGHGDGTFGPAQSFAVGRDPYTVAVADFGNGHPDLVTPNSTANTVSVLLGNGDGTFQPAQSFPEAGTPRSVAVADLGNGRPDIVTCNIGTNTVSVLLGNGDGTFQPAQSFPVGSVPYSVVVADVNGDGHPDIVTANAGNNTVSVLLGNGDGTFQPARAFDVGSVPDSVAVADVNGDGRPDIVTADYGSSTVTVLLGNGDGTFALDSFSSPGWIPGLFTVGSVPYSLALADLGNGHIDIVTANEGDDTVSVLLGNGDGSFGPAQSFDVGSVPRSVAVADLGNGHPDIVTANFSSGTVTVLLGNGDGTFTPDPSSSAGWPPGTFAVGFDPYSVAVADLGNGHPDIVTANAFDSTVTVLLGNGDGTFEPAQPFDVGFVPDSVAVANLGNGHADIVTANYGANTVSVLLGNGDDTFQQAQSFAVGNVSFAVAVANLGNGQTDTVTTNYVADTVSVSLGNGDGTFQPAQSFGVGSGPDSVALADVNGDGRPDIVTTNAIDDTVSVLLGNGDGTFQPVQSFAVGLRPDSVAIADLGNGHADIVTANAAANTVSVLLGNGDGTFQPAKSLAVGSDPESVAIANLGNGHADIVTANNGDNTVSVLLGNGDGTFGPARPYPVGSDPESVTLADLGNGRLDLITANYGDDTVSVLLGNGDGTFGPAQSFVVGSLPHSVVVADLGNGHPDIVTANYGASTVSVLLGNGNGTFHSALSVAVGSLPESVAVADVNDDGRRDIITAHGGINGTVSVLLNLGNVQFQAPSGPSGIPSQDVPQLQDLTGDGIPDAVSLDQHTGLILFRQGTGDPSNPYAPLIVVNQGQSATDFTLVQTAGLPEIAALDSVDQQVILYAWSSTVRQFQEIGSFATGPQPVRIASADLDGNGLGDIVVANALNNTLTIALRQSPGIFTTFTRNIGAGPSSISFADLNGDSLLDIVVSDQVSGDVSVLFNDASHSFITQERYRAGQDPFDVSPGPTGTTLVTQLQTVGVVAGDFAGNRGTELVALNADTHSVNLLRAAGGGSLIDPQVTDSYPVGPGAIQVLAGDFLNNGREDLAVLTTQQNPNQPTQPGVGQVLVFLNNGNGTFSAPIVSSAGEGASGFSFVAAGNGQPGRFLVGDAYGDFLTLVGDGRGHFSVDRGNLDGKPLAVGKTADGQTFVVVADQSEDQVQVYFQNSGSSASGSSPFVLAATLPRNPALLAPGAVQLVDLNKSGNGNNTLDLVVASRLGNDVLVYPRLPGGGFRHCTGFLGRLRAGCHHGRRFQWRWHSRPGRGQPGFQRRLRSAGPGRQQRHLERLYRWSPAQFGRQPAYRGPGRHLHWPAGHPRPARDQCGRTDRHPGGHRRQRPGQRLLSGCHSHRRQSARHHPPGGLRFHRRRRVPGRARRYPGHRRWHRPV